MSRLPPGLVIVTYHPDDFPDSAKGRTSFKYDRARQTTYCVTSLMETRLQDYEGLAGVNRSLFQACNAMIYGHLLFHCSPEAALAFLHDHTRKLRFIKDIEVFYSLRLDDKMDTVKATSVDGQQIESYVTGSPRGSWRRFCNVLVHYCPNVENCHLIIGAAILRREIWKKGIAEVFKRPDGAIVEEKELSSALEHVARLCGRKVGFQLSIQGTTSHGKDDRKKLEKRERLERFMIEAMHVRPYYNENRECDCRERTLEKSCIWNWRHELDD